MHQDQVTDEVMEAVGRRTIGTTQILLTIVVSGRKTVPFVVMTRLHDTFMTSSCLGRDQGARGRSEAQVEEYFGRKNPDVVDSPLYVDLGPTPVLM